MTVAITLVCALAISAAAPPPEPPGGLQTVGVSFTLDPVFAVDLLRGWHQPDQPGWAEFEQDMGVELARGFSRSFGFLEFAPDPGFAPDEADAPTYRYTLHVSVQLPKPESGSDGAATGEVAGAEHLQAFSENHFGLELFDRNGVSQAVLPMAYVKLAEEFARTLRADVKGGVLSTAFEARLADQRPAIVKHLLSRVPISRTIVYVTSEPTGESSHASRVLLPFSYDDLFVKPGTRFLLEDFGPGVAGGAGEAKRAVVTATDLRGLNSDIEVIEGYFRDKGVPDEALNPSLFPRPIILRDPTPQEYRPPPDQEAIADVHGLLLLKDLPAASGQYFGRAEWGIFVSEYAPRAKGLERMLLDSDSIGPIRTLRKNPFVPAGLASAN